MYLNPKVKNKQYIIHMMTLMNLQPLGYQQMIIAAEFDCIVRKIPVTWLFKQHEYGAI